MTINLTKKINCFIIKNKYKITSSLFPSPTSRRIEVALRFLLDKRTNREEGRLKARPIESRNFPTLHRAVSTTANLADRFKSVADYAILSNLSYQALKDPSYFKCIVDRQLILIPDTCDFTHYKCAYVTYIFAILLFIKYKKCIMLFEIIDLGNN